MKPRSRLRLQRRETPKWINDDEEKRPTKQ